MSFSFGDFNPENLVHNTYPVSTPVGTPEMLREKLNYDQRRRFHNSTYSTFYLLDIEKIPDSFVLSISGSTRNIYKIRVNEQTRKITCDCPDAKGHCHRHNTICKHSYFMLFKIIKMWELAVPDNDFFTTNILSEASMATIHDKLMNVMRNFGQANTGDETFINRNLANTYQRHKESIISSKEDNEGGAAADGNEGNLVSRFTCLHITENEDPCPVCYNDIENTRDTVVCPCCHNKLHSACMERWFQMGNQTCVLCRSDVWKEYIEQHSTEITNDFSNDYDNLWRLSTR
jgi:hypothetical protein